jgi:hypothetical protein
VFVCRRKGGSLYRSWNSSCTCGYRSWNLNHNLKKVVCFPFPCHFFLLYATATDFCTKMQVFLSANYICSIRMKCKR